MRPHIKLNPDPAYSRVIVCGSPERAAFISTFLTQEKSLAKNREYHSYLGKFKGVDILVTSHGIGSAGAAICFQELMDVGAQAIIRIGTAGGLYPKAQIGDIVIPRACIRRDGVSSQMIPEPYPAVPDLELVWHLGSRMKTKGKNFVTGITLTSDLFYPSLLGHEWIIYRDAHALAVEMECSTLFIAGSLREVKTAAMLVLDGNPLAWSEGQEGNYDPDPERLSKSMSACIETALETLGSL